MAATRDSFGGAWRWVAIATALAVMALAMLGLRSELASAGGAARLQGGNEVEIDHFAFHPPALTVAAGTRVVFHNSSGVTHTATRNGVFDTGRIKPGGSIAIRFNHAGTFSYHCSIHPFMHGKIVVK
jgi:plastocyanin